MTVSPLLFPKTDDGPYVVRVTESEYFTARERLGPPVTWLEAEQLRYVRFNAETRLIEISAKLTEIIDAVRGGS